MKCFCLLNAPLPGCGFNCCLVFLFQILRVIASNNKPSRLEMSVCVSLLKDFSIFQKMFFIGCWGMGGRWGWGRGDSLAERVAVVTIRRQSGEVLFFKINVIFHKRVIGFALRLPIHPRRPLFGAPSSAGLRSPEHTAMSEERVARWQTSASALSFSVFLGALVFPARQ